MKKLVMTVAVLATAASVVTAQTVTSANVVGYSKKNIGAGAFKMVADQFVVDNEAGVSIGEAFGTSLPDGSELYSWNGSVYLVFTYFDGLGWFDGDFNDATGVVISRGDALWVKNAGGTATDLIVSGNVPQSGSTTNSLTVGYNLVANPYPTAVALSQLNINPVDGDELYLFDGVYTTYTYFEGLGWFDGDFNDANAVEVPVGEGFWYNTITARSWIVNIPYTL